MNLNEIVFEDGKGYLLFNAHGTNFVFHLYDTDGLNPTLYFSDVITNSSGVKVPSFAQNNAFIRIPPNSDDIRNVFTQEYLDKCNAFVDTFAPQDDKGNFPKGRKYTIQLSWIFQNLIEVVDGKVMFKG